MIDDLDAFDASLEAQEPLEEQKIVRRSNIAIRDAIVNPDVCARLVKGESIASLALEIGVNPATIRKWMFRGEMKDLLAIEARRIMKHMTRRPLKEVKYKDLAQSLTTLMGEESRQRNGQLEQNTGVINQTTIEQINILVSGQRDRGEGAKNISGTEEFTGEDIPELPEEFESPAAQEAPVGPGGSTKS